MAFVCFRHDLIRYEFSSISLRHSSAHRSALLIAHDVHAGASSLYLSRVFGQLFLILLRPGFGCSITSLSTFATMISVYHNASIAAHRASATCTR